MPSVRKVWASADPDATAPGSVAVGDRLTCQANRPGAAPRHDVLELAER